MNTEMRDVALRLMSLPEPAEGLSEAEVDAGLRVVYAGLGHATETMPDARDEFAQGHTDDEGDSGLVACFAVLPEASVRLALRDGGVTRGWEDVPADEAVLHRFVGAAVDAAAVVFLDDDDKPQVRPAVGRPAFLAGTLRRFHSGGLRSLEDVICVDGACGGLASGCGKEHVPAGSVAVELALDLSMVVPLSTSRWAHAKAGGYVPADQIDMVRHESALAAQGLREDDPASWGWQLRAEARASTGRVLTGDTEAFDLPEWVVRNDTNTVAFWALRSGDVKRVLPSP